jgi:hypothetical protein
VEETYTVPLTAELMREGPWSNSLPFTLFDADRPPHVQNFSKHWGPINGGEITDLFGDDFAPTEHLMARFGNADSSIVNYGPATFISVYHIRVEIPRYHEPATVEVREDIRVAAGGGNSENGGGGRGSKGRADVRYRAPRAGLKRSPMHDYNALFLQGLCGHD